MGGGTLARLVIAIDSQVAGATAGINSVKGAAGGMERSVGTAEKRLRFVSDQATRTGRALTTGLTVPLVAIAAGSLKAATDFESSFAGVRKTVDATESEFADLSQGFRDMAKTIPVNVNELNAIGEAAGQLGIKKEAILDFTEVMAKLGVTTNLSSDEAATALARLSAVMGTNQEDYDRLGSTIVDLGNNFETTEAEIVEFGQRMAGAGKIAGLTESNVLSIGAAMSSVGVKAEAGGTAVQKVLLKITEQVATGGDQLQRYAEVAGMSASDFATAWEQDAAGAFTDFVEGLGRSGQDAIGILSDLGLEDQRLIRSFLSLAGAGDKLRESIDMGNTAWEENTALTAEAEQRFETFASQLQVLKNQALDVAISIGQALMPSAKLLVGFLGNVAVPIIDKIVGVFTALPAPIQAVGVGFGVLLAAAGPVLWMAGSMAGAMLNLLPTLRLVSLAMGPLSTNIRLVGASLMWLAANPVVLIVAGIAALATGLVIAYKKSETFRNIVNTAFRAVAKVAGVAVAGILKALQGMAKMWMSQAGFMLRAAEKAFGWIPGIGPKLKSAVKDFDAFAGGVNDAFDKATDAALSWGDTTEEETKKASKAVESNTKVVVGQFTGQKRALEDTSKSVDKWRVTVEEATGKGSTAVERAGMTHDSWTRQMIDNHGRVAQAVEQGASAHDSWASQVGKAFSEIGGEGVKFASDHDSWRAGMEENLRANQSAHDSWTSILQEKYAESSTAVEEFAETKQVQTAGLIQNLAIEGEALTEFKEGAIESFNAATSVVAKFGTQTDVTGAQVLEFFASQTTAAEEWANNLRELAKLGLEQGLLLELFEAGPEAAGLVKAILDTAAQGGIETINQTRGQQQEILANLMQDLFGTVPEAGEAGSQVGGSFAGGISRELQAARPHLAGAGIDTARALNASSQSKHEGDVTGWNWGSGMNRGMSGWTNSLAIQAKNIVINAYNAAKRWLESRSPSRKTERDIGIPFAQGIAEGIKGEAEVVAEAVRGVVDPRRMASSVRVATAGLGQLIESANKQAMQTLRASQSARVDGRGIAAGVNGTARAEPQEIVIRLDSSDEALLELLRKGVRKRGGNVQVVIGQGGR